MVYVAFSIWGIANPYLDSAYSSKHYINLSYYPFLNTYHCIVFANNFFFPFLENVSYCLPFCVSEFLLLLISFLFFSYPIFMFTSIFPWFLKANSDLPHTKHELSPSHMNDQNLALHFILLFQGPHQVLLKVYPCSLPRLPLSVLGINSTLPTKYKLQLFQPFPWPFFFFST